MKKSSTMDYEAELQRTPAPGNGCHPHLLRVANLGVRHGLAPDQVAADIRSAIPAGRRRVSDREIRVTVQKAFNEKSAASCSQPWRPYQPRQRPKLDAAALLQRIMAEGSPDEADLWESSPLRLDGPPEDDAALLLRHFYRPDEFLFLGDVYDKRVMPVADWLQRIKHGGTAGLPHVISNPFTGREHETTMGTMSRRCDAAVSRFRFAMIEFDDMPRERQLAFWSGVIKCNLLPVACLIDSGGKSIHAWIHADVADRAAWDAKVKQKLFEQYMIPLGADPTSRNPARLSRLPGHYRAKTGRWQRLLWLDERESFRPKK